MKKHLSAKGWTTADMPPQNGRSVIITGTGGLGYETALALAAAGAEVILAGRNAEKGEESVKKILAIHHSANIRFEPLDLASLSSIKEFGTRMKAERVSLDLLINNAGVMTPPSRRLTADGFELQFGTNHLGHFALTAQLLPLLWKGQSPRIVNVSSIAARDGFINFDDLQAAYSYKPMLAYSRSKLANLMFTFELQRRSNTQGWGVASLAAHPGVSRTDLLPNGAGSVSFAGLMRKFLWFMFQPAAQGALPSLFAACSPDAEGGGYYGPHKLMETRGYPVPAKIPSQAEDEGAALRLWNLSETLTGVKFI